MIAMMLDEMEKEEACEYASAFASAQKIENTVVTVSGKSAEEASATNDFLLNPDNIEAMAGEREESE